MYRSYLGSLRYWLSRTQRASRTRRKSICASATRRAVSSTAALALSPASARARFSASSESKGSIRTDTLSPWRQAFCAERILPCRVLGPVLALAFARLALIFSALVMQRSCWIILRD